jgi:hypothetical protein
LGYLGLFGFFKITHQNPLKALIDIRYKKEEIRDKLIENRN